MSVVLIKLKDALKIAIEKERQSRPNPPKEITIFKHVKGMPIYDEEYIIKLWCEGKRYRDISKITGYHLGTIGRKVRMYKEQVYKEQGMNSNRTRSGCIPKVIIPGMVEA